MAKDGAPSWDSAECANRFCRKRSRGALSLSQASVKRPCRTSARTASSIIFNSRLCPVGTHRRRVPRRCVPGRGAEVACAGPGRNDGLDALSRPSGAVGVDIMGSVCDQAGPRRVGPGLAPGLGEVGTRATRHAQAQEAAPAIHQAVDLGLKLPQLRPSTGSVSLLGHARRAWPIVLSRRPADIQIGPQAPRDPCVRHRHRTGAPRPHRASMAGLYRPAENARGHTPLEE